MQPTAVHTGSWPAGEGRNEWWGQGGLPGRTTVIGPLGTLLHIRPRGALHNARAGPPPGHGWHEGARAPGRAGVLPFMECGGTAGKRRVVHRATQRVHPPACLPACPGATHLWPSTSTAGSAYWRCCMTKGMLCSIAPRGSTTLPSKTSLLVTTLANKNTCVADGSPRCVDCCWCCITAASGPSVVNNCCALASPPRAGGACNWPRLLGRASAA